MWLLGNAYKGSGFYGAYPPSYLRRVRALFPDVPPEVWLHLYSGSLGPEVPGLRLDISMEPGRMRPSIVADARHVPIRSGSIRLSAADPPYSKPDAVRYGTPIVLNKPQVLRELARVTVSGGFLVWLDTTLPLYDGKVWRHFGMICVQRSTNHRTRLCSLFQRC